MKVESRNGAREEKMGKGEVLKVVLEFEILSVFIRK